MPHGWPDYFMTLPKENVFGTFDTLEPIARIGFLAPGLRRGNVFWCDFCQYLGKTWFVTFEGTAPRVYKSFERPLFGVPHLHFSWPALTKGTVTMQAPMLQPPITLLAVELHVWHDLWLEKITIGYHFLAPGKNYFYDAQINWLEQKIKWHKERYVWVSQDFSELPERIPRGLYYLRLGIDPAKCRYRYLMINTRVIFPPDIEVIPYTGTIFEDTIFYVQVAGEDYGVNFSPQGAFVYINDL